MAKPPRRPLGRGGGGTKTMLTWAFLLVLAAAVQSQSQSVHSPKSIETLFASTRSTKSSRSLPSQAGSSPPEIPLLNHYTTLKSRSTDDDPSHRKFNALAPAPEFGAVRAPLAQSVESPKGLSLNPARLLRNWEAENIILIATIDGAIHAKDRNTGDPRWSLGINDSPMIQTIHHCHNQSENGQDDCDHDYIFIVEPSKDGDLYIQHKNPQIGLQRLGVTVKGLAAEVPGFIEEPPLVTIAQTETTAYVVDAASGVILSQFSRRPAYVDDKERQSCRRLSGFEPDDPACTPIGTINLGRVEYTVTISHKFTQEELCTIKFAEWVPNKQDNDLQQQYVAPFDSSHIQTYFNGRIQGLDANPPDGKFHRWQRMMDSPVARVFDVVRPLERGHELGELKVLSRPLDAPLLAQAQYWKDDIHRAERVFVNRTESGIWYALSELSYPGVTAGAKPAGVQWNFDGTPLDFEHSMDDIVGVHVLSPERSIVPLRLTIDGKTQNSAVAVDADKPSSAEDVPLTAPNVMSQISNSWQTLANLVLVAIFIFWVGILCRFPLALRLKDRLSMMGFEVILTSPKGRESAANVSTANDTLSVATVQSPGEAEKVTEIVNEVVEEALATPVRSRAHSSITFTASLKKDDKLADDTELGSDAESDGENELGASGDAQENDSGPKRRTKRGKRGGQKNKKKKKKQMDPEAMDASTNFSSEDHPEPGVTTIGRLRIDTKDDACIGQGSNGTVVFRGTMDDGRAVAVKRLLRHSSALAAKEIKHLLSSDENPHVIRYIGKEESHSFIYIALDLFRTSLDRFVEKPLDFPDLIKLPEGYDVKDCLTQVTEGVAHLHSLKLVHRDIKPQNVLVRSIRTQRPTDGLPKLNFVISDFGLCKPLDEGPESAFAATANHTAAGTTGWRAPELLVNPSDLVAAPNADSSTSKSATHSTTNSVDGTVTEPTTGRRATKAIDIFSLGCVFYYVMTQGKHPFDVGGTSLGRDLMIKENRSSTTDVQKFFGYPYDAEDLILQMIMHSPKDRPDTTAILKHPFFWGAEQKLDFICDVSDCYEKEKNSIKDIHNENAPRTEAEIDSLRELAALQERSEDVITKRDFLQALPQSFIREMGKQRKYTGNKMIDLLRVIRNKKNHFYDLPADVQDMMLGGSTKGYWAFWEKRFPSLLIVCHCLLIERGIVGRFKLERYY